MKYIITGGAGFIGSHLVENLVKLNKKIVVLDNLSTGRLDNIRPFLKKIKFIKCDISKKGKWMSEFNEKCYIFHLAALADIVPSMQNPEKYFNSNVRGTLNLLEASRKTKVIKFLYSASSSCYGIPKKYPTKEEENYIKYHLYHSDYLMFMELDPEHLELMVPCLGFFLLKKYLRNHLQ